MTSQDDSPKPAPIHPGEILREDFLTPLGLSQDRLAQDLSVPPRHIDEIVHGKQAITADTALRLARYFGTSEQFWLNLQSRYDLEAEHDRLEDVALVRAIQEGETRELVSRDDVFRALALDTGA